MMRRIRIRGAKDHPESIILGERISGGWKN
jgi:hypothetical protein